MSDPRQDQDEQQQLITTALDNLAAGRASQDDIHWISLAIGFEWRPGTFDPYHVFDYPYTGD